MRRAAVALLPLLPSCNEHSLQPVDLTTTSEYSATFCAAPAPLVDVLIVMDEAPSMIEEVSAIASGLEVIGDVYDSAVRRLDFRIAVVSSQLAADGSAPFVDTSCRERGEAFIAPGIDLHAVGCLDVCKLAALETSSTSIDGDPVARPRPWIELLDLQSNLRGGIDVRDDLACRGALGFRGTQPRQPLAAMTRALAQSADPNDPTFGFIRDEASLFVLFVTDADDASPGPVEDYAGLLASIRDVKRRALPSSPPRVLVSVIGGVGDDETLDAAHLGCASERGMAAPPLRLMQLASEFAEFPSWQGTPWFSICGEPWTDAPACVPGWSPFDSALCLEGCLDPEVPACEVTRTDLMPIDDCELTEVGDAVLPEGAVECAVVQADAGRATSPGSRSSDRAGECRAAIGRPARSIRGPGVRAPAWTGERPVENSAVLGPVRAVSARSRTGSRELPSGRSTRRTPAPHAREGSGGSRTRARRLR